MTPSLRPASRSKKIYSMPAGGNSIPPKADAPLAQINHIKERVSVFVLLGESAPYACT